MNNVKYVGFRIALEPMDDAAMRSYCDENGMTYALFVRLALQHMLATVTKKQKKLIPSHRDVYGRVTKSAITVRMTDDERKSIVRFARMMNFKEKRSFARLLRYAIKTYLAACDDASRQAQSPEPACEGSPPH